MRGLYKLVCFDNNAVWVPFLSGRVAVDLLGPVEGNSTEALIHFGFPVFKLGLNLNFMTVSARIWNTSGRIKWDKEFLLKINLWHRTLAHLFILCFLVFVLFLHFKYWDKVVCILWILLQLPALFLVKMLTYLKETETAPWDALTSALSYCKPA